MKKYFSKKSSKAIRKLNITQQEKDIGFLMMKKIRTETQTPKKGDIAYFNLEIKDIQRQHHLF